MELFYTDHFELPLPENHRFPMDKYRMLRQAVAGELVGRQHRLRVPAAATDEQLRLAHAEDYIHRVQNGQLTVAEIKRIGFPWSPKMVERSRRSTGATIAAARSALVDGVGVNLAGGTHHAFADAGEGYCVFNDTACAARVMQAEGWIKRAVILDCDVHQGNGTAAILQNDPSIFTMSIHGAKNFPLRKVASDLDVPLDDGIGDDEYLSKLAPAVTQSLERSRADMAFYLAGADPYQGDRLGRLAVSKEGLIERDRFVFAACQERAIPVVVVMAGGYARVLEDLVSIHFNTVKLARDMFSS